MQNHLDDPLAFFRLRPLKAARVSEISEATASSSAAPEERVNFHIGNPVQDDRLASAYLRAVLGIDIRQEELHDADLSRILTQLEWGEEDLPKLAFLKALIRKSAPYTPRGGFARANPNELVTRFMEWIQTQQEPLTYDLGQSSGKREVILASGGVQESLRVLFHALASFMVVRPASMFFHRIVVGDGRTYEGLTFEHLPDDDHEAIEVLRARLLESPRKPAFLVMGSILGEDTRRLLWHLSLEHPLFFVEANDAPNHSSLAREAKLVQRVIRILTPAIFGGRFRHLATTFLVGNADILGAFESVHFQLKGTPSASEIELLSYLLNFVDRSNPAAPSSPEISVEPSYPVLSFHGGREYHFPLNARFLDDRLGGVVEKIAGTLEARLNGISRNVEAFSARIGKFRAFDPLDRFSRMETKAFLEELVERCESPSWQRDLTHSMLLAFVKHHPEYPAGHCLVVSGSSRTALGLLGFHCGITEVIMADLSWSYEHCFPNVLAVPLTREYALDVEGIIAAVQQKLIASPGWSECGAVVINNPHNATGRIFAETEVRRLIRWLLDHGVFVIDDLSYQDVAPVMDLPAIKTVRQHADDLVRTGELTEEQTARVITVHSVSKTDCLAGARLAVIELRNEELFRRFSAVHSQIRPNLGALALTYLFYRNETEVARAYWRLRNRIFHERSGALLEAVEDLPHDRNPYEIGILPPTGSMYPLLIIEQLPPGLSLDWLASGLARQGIGMLPLSTFARTESGFETGRKTFRLTLGGTDGADILLKKTRRVLIDLNRLIAEEAARYNRLSLPVSSLSQPAREFSRNVMDRWNLIEAEILRTRMAVVPRGYKESGDEESLKRFREVYVPERLAVFRRRCMDRSLQAGELMARAHEDRGKELMELLGVELYKDSLARREDLFRMRPSDRTVHPTQMYSIRSEIAFDEIIARLLRGLSVSPEIVASAAEELLEEFFGRNVAITSSEESDELILDLDAVIAAENATRLASGTTSRNIVSFWGDWDGSNRPSGQGHRLVATTLIENVTRLARLLWVLMSADEETAVDPGLLAEVRRLPENNLRFTKLLNDITILTHQLEKRYKGILPFSVKAGPWRSFGMKINLARDPVTLLWQHNDRLERKMVDLRTRRRETLEYYFSLNKQLRKQLRALLPDIQEHMHEQSVLLEAGSFRDLLQRMVITPRIDQKMTTAQDSFAIDTTVFNIHEINEIAAKYGNPGLILSLQVSMSTQAEALISLDRKLRARREQCLRTNPGLEFPTIQLIPLFEDPAAVRSIPAYLTKIWEYALQSRRVNQDTADRFSEIILEVFIAGSDLSQQVGQASGAASYRQAKHDIMLWLAEHHLIDRVRIKMGSGEPMQRQGGYYAGMSGDAAFVRTPAARKLIAMHLPAAARKSTEYATTPLMGLFTGNDLRTLQSTVSEQLRHLPVQEMANVFYHLAESQRRHRDDLIRAAQTLVESRLQQKKRGAQELERLTVGVRDPVYDQFLTLLTEDFRQILYGREEDVVGIHMISYFIARTLPQLRDRPTIRMSAGAGSDRGERILEQIARIIPLARHGSRLRAIAHNQSQTTVLGFNQLTTGLFRALDRFVQLEFKEGDARSLITDRILPQLPVYEMLNTLRIYHDADLTYLKRIEPAFPAGTSALLAVREDNDSMPRYIGALQQELLRRHGLDVSDFVEGGKLIPELLPTLRPDLAVLLQGDLFNTDPENFFGDGKIDAGEQWRTDVERLLTQPREIKSWRSKIWDLLERPLFQRVQSFVELAVALNSLSSTHPLKNAPGTLHSMKMSTELSHFFRTSNSTDDMRQFLAASLEYLGALTEGMVEVPVTIIRSLKEVETIAKIEEQALSPGDQELLRFYMLQIARLAGENG